MMPLDSPRLYHIQILIIAVLGSILLYQVSDRNTLQIDFTEEKRFTLHPSVNRLVSKLEDPVTIEVFLSGELPSNFKRLQNAIRQKLERFALEADQNIQFKFSDPSIAASTQARNRYYRQLIDKGIQPSNISYVRDGQKTEKLVFPGAILNYRGQEIGITLLKGNRTRSIDEMLNQSIEGLEYELANAIQQLTSGQKRRIGFVTGHNDLDSAELAGFTNAVLSRYELYRIDLRNRQTSLKGYDAVVIGKPSVPFTEEEKFFLDQYVMNGGNMLFFMDALSVNMQEAEGEGTIAVPNELNLDDLLFRYGIRVNRDYVADVNCGNTPVVTGIIGDQPRIELLPWPYWPIVTNYSSHPIVRNLDATWFRGASTIDTVKADGIIKTPLFLTSPYTRVFGPPVRISYNDLNDKLKPEAFTSGPQTLGYVLEGKFTSLYKNRFLPEVVNKQNYQEDGIEAKIVVVSDGDFIRNDFSLENDNPLPMGMDTYSQVKYANEDFLVNALDYVVDDYGLMAARRRELKIRPLDRVKVESSGSFWKWMNIGTPILLVVIFGLAKSFIRKAKHGWK